MSSHCISGCRCSKGLCDLAFFPQFAADDSRDVVGENVGELFFKSTTQSRVLPGDELMAVNFAGDDRPARPCWFCADMLGCLVPLEATGRICGAIGLLHQSLPANFLNFRPLPQEQRFDYVRL